jgi:hypothetical protein
MEIRTRRRGKTCRAHEERRGGERRELEAIQMW